jgi:hypothetical protein
MNLRAWKSGKQKACRLSAHHVARDLPALLELLTVFAARIMATMTKMKIRSTMLAIFTAPANVFAAIAIALKSRTLTTLTISLTCGSMVKKFDGIKP